MARVQFGGIVTGLRGKVGGSVFSNNKSGPTYGTKTTAVKAGPKKAKQANIIGSASRAWRQLSEGDRLAFGSNASMYPRTNSLGATYYLTGFQLFCARYGSIASIDQPPLTAFVNPASANNNVNTLTLLASQATNPTGVNASWDDGAENTGVWVKVFLSRCVSVGKFSVSGNYKLVTQVLASVETVTVSPASYSDFFGTYTVGTAIFMRLIQVNVNSGVESVLADNVKLIVQEE